jgi:predicted regulator of Ras-like GTPase activity (Roadblock/LC7/MglB family)
VAIAPEAVAASLCETAPDARAAVVLDASGELAGSSEENAERSRTLAATARELLEAVDAAAPGDAPEQMECQVDRGGVYLVRGKRWTLVTVTRRAALSSLMFFDMRVELAKLEGES